MKQIMNRMTDDTPRFFRNLRTIGLCLMAIVITVAGYVAVAGSVMTAVSQAAVKNEKE